MVVRVKKQRYGLLRQRRAAMARKKNKESMTRGRIRQALPWWESLGSQRSSHGVQDSSPSSSSSSDGPSSRAADALDSLAVVSARPVQREKDKYPNKKKTTAETRRPLDLLSSLEVAATKRVVPTSKPKSLPTTSAAAGPKKKESSHQFEDVTDSMGALTISSSRPTSRGEKLTRKGREGKDNKRRGVPAARPLENDGGVLARAREQGESPAAYRLHRGRGPSQPMQSSATCTLEVLASGTWRSPKSRDSSPAARVLLRRVESRSPSRRGDRPTSANWEEEDDEPEELPNTTAGGLVSFFLGRTAFNKSSRSTAEADYSLDDMDEGHQSLDEDDVPSTSQPRGSKRQDVSPKGAARKRRDNKKTPAGMKRPVPDRTGDEEIGSKVFDLEVIEGANPRASPVREAMDVEPVDVDIVYVGRQEQFADTAPTAVDLNSSAFLEEPADSEPVEILYEDQKLKVPAGLARYLSSLVEKQGPPDDESSDSSPMDCEETTAQETDQKATGPAKRKGAKGGSKFDEDTTSEQSSTAPGVRRSSRERAKPDRFGGDDPRSAETDAKSDIWRNASADKGSNPETRQSGRDRKKPDRFGTSDDEHAASDLNEGEPSSDTRRSQRERKKPDRLGANTDACARLQRSSPIEELSSCEDDASGRPDDKPRRVQKGVASTEDATSNTRRSHRDRKKPDWFGRGDNSSGENDASHSSPTPTDLTTDQSEDDDDCFEEYSSLPAVERGAAEGAAASKPASNVAAKAEKATKQVRFSKGVDKKVAGAEKAFAALSMSADGWTMQQLIQLQKAHGTVNPTSTTFWEDVASSVEGKSASECREQWWSSLKSPAPKLARATKKVANQQVEELDDEDDLFNATPMRGLLLSGVKELHEQKRAALPKGVDIGSAIKVDANFTKRPSSDMDVEGENLPPIKFQPKAGYKSYLQDMRRELNRSLKEPKGRKKKDSSCFTKNGPRTLSERIKDSDVDMTARLSPGGTLKVENRGELDDDFWDELHDGESDEHM